MIHKSHIDVSSFQKLSAIVHLTSEYVIGTHNITILNT